MIDLDVHRLALHHCASKCLRMSMIQEATLPLRASFIEHADQWRRPRPFARGAVV